MAVYAAQIEEMDREIGKIREKLTQLELEKDTFILFTSDNGACGGRASGGWVDL